MDQRVRPTAFGCLAHTTRADGTITSNIIKVTDTWSERAEMSEVQTKDFSSA